MTEILGWNNVTSVDGRTAENLAFARLSMTGGNLVVSASVTIRISWYCTGGRQRHYGTYWVSSTGFLVLYQVGGRDISLEHTGYQTLDSVSAVMAVVSIVIFAVAIRLEILSVSHSQERKVYGEFWYVKPHVYNMVL